VAALVEGAPESEEGLLPGDLIISLNSQPVVNVNSLQDLLRNLKTGSAVVLQVQREDQLKFVLQYLSWKL
jgi:S1-C subfamily serine protease